jgi:serine/threonine protein kinase
MTPPDSPGETDVEKLRGQLASALGDDYTLGAVLGAGRSGVVFLARNVAANRDVAIKVAWDHPAARSHLARETSLTSAIVHPHVLAMRKLYLAKPIFVIEMPIAPGGTLDNRFEKGGAVSFQYVRAILRQVAGAFDEAHAMGIVHGSLCPAKILLDENGQCLVSDFGLRIPVLAGAAALHPSELGIPAYTPINTRSRSSPTSCFGASGRGMSPARESSRSKHWRLRPIVRSPRAYRSARAWPSNAPQRASRRIAIPVSRTLCERSPVIRRMRFRSSDTSDADGSRAGAHGC